MHGLAIVTRQRPDNFFDPCKVAIGPHATRCVR